MSEHRDTLMLSFVRITRSSSIFARCVFRGVGDSMLIDHLKGNLHNERFAAAKVTLFGPNPWPFNDGVLFFDSSVENDRQLEARDENKNGLLGFHGDDSLAVVEYNKMNDKKTCIGHVETGSVLFDIIYSTGSKALDGDRENGNLLIPKVLIKDELSDLSVSFMGIGKLAARFILNKDVAAGISRIWCEWLGSMANIGHDLLAVPMHDFAIVVFGCDYYLGRKGLLGDVKSLLYSNPVLELESGKNDHEDRKRKWSLSEPEGMSESIGNQFDSSGEDSLASSNSSPRLLLEKFDDQILHSRTISSKAARRELRRHQRITAEKMCDIFQQKMLPGKDVATLMNPSTGNLACSSWNLNGAFHVFPTSCLIQWVLLCESEIAINQLGNPKTMRKSRIKKASSCINSRKDCGKMGMCKPILSAFCPECQGTGSIMEVDNLENPSVPLSEVRVPILIRLILWNMLDFCSMKWKYSSFSL